MAVWVILLVFVAAGVAAVLLYRQRADGGGLPRPRGKSTGRLAQRVQDGRGSIQEPWRDEFVDSQAAVWDVGHDRPPDTDDLFPDDVPVVEPRGRAREEFFNELPYAEDDDDEDVDDGVDDDAVDAYDERAADEDEAYADDDSEPSSRRAVVTPTLVVLDEDEDVDRFAPRSSYVPGLAEEDELGEEFLGELMDDEVLVEEAAEAAPAAVFDAEPELDDDEDDNESAPDGTKPLARRTPKAGDEVYRRPLRLAQTTQRPSGGNRRSPEQVRSMLANYRTGLSKGRREPTDDE